jgi:hypothetical protein
MTQIFRIYAESNQLRIKNMKSIHLNSLKPLRSLIIFAATAALFASCSQDNDVPNSSAARVAVQFSASALSATPQTRTTAGGDSWVENDLIGIFMVDNGTDDIAESVSNYRYKATATSSLSDFVADGSMAYYPVSGGKVDFIAYYPYSSTQGFGTYQINVASASQDDQTAIDLLWAKANKGGNGYSKADGLLSSPVDLVFSHQLSKLIMTVEKGAGIDDLTGLTILIAGVNTTAQFDLTDGTLDAVGGPVGIVPKVTTTPTDSEDGVYEAIVLPVSNAGVKVEFTLPDGNTYTWDLEASITTGFQAGKKYIYTITLSKTGLTLTGNITAWSSVNNSGTAE